MKKLLFVAFTVGATACFAEEDLVRWVDPLVGTVNEGNMFPGTCYPFGQVQASPDSGTRVWCPGYKHTDTTIRGFSQTHLNGTGRPAMGDVSLMPFCGETNGVNFDSPFKKENQSCAPDYYSVVLDRYGVKAEATSSQRVGWWRFTYPKGVRKQILVDAAAMLMQAHNIKYGPRILDSSYEISKDRTEIRGGKQGRGWTPYRHFYSIKFDREPTNIRLLSPDAFDGKGDRFIVDFDGDDTVLVQVGVSGVSATGASLNRLAETKGRTFESVRAANRAAWNALLARARLVKGTEEQKKNWYTSLYHLCIQPNDQTDVDGKYRAANDTVKTAKGGYYSTFSLWDTFRAAHPFYTILGRPEKTAHIVQALCRDAYKPTPDGLCGNDDCGQMSAWYLFSMLGFYPFNPCDDGYVFGAPQAEEMVLALPGRRTLTVRAEGLTDKRCCVDSVMLNGRRLDGFRLSHAELISGGELVFVMK